MCPEVEQRNSKKKKIVKDPGDSNLWLLTLMEKLFILVIRCEKYI